MMEGCEPSYWIQTTNQRPGASTKPVNARSISLATNNSLPEIDFACIATFFPTIPAYHDASIGAVLHNRNPAAMHSRLRTTLLRPRGQEGMDICCPSSTLLRQDSSSRVHDQTIPKLGSREDDPLSLSSVAFLPAHVCQIFIGAETMLLPKRRSRKERHTMYFSGHWTRCSVTLLRLRRRLSAR